MTNFETPGRELEQVARDGAALGGARIPEDEAVGEGSGAQRWISGVEKARSAVVAERSLQEKVPAAKRVATEQARLAASAAKAKVIGRRIERLEQADLPRAEARVHEQKHVVDAVRARYQGLPRHQRGFIGVPVILGFIEVAVVAFDGGSLHTALAKAGYSTAAVWFLSATVPLLLLAVNHALGTLGGLIAGALTTNRQRVAVGTFAAGFGVLMTAFILVTIFRADAVSGHNAALGTWASGNHNRAPSFLISPIWLGPAQIAGSIAAISSVALFTLAKPGRELRRHLREEQQTLAALKGEEAGIRGEIKGGYRERDAELLVPAAIEAEVAEAQAELDAYPEIHAQRLAAEEGLAEAARGKLLTSFLYADRIHANGRVWTVALPSVRFLGYFRLKPGPGSESQPIDTPKGERSNGHRPTTPDELRPLVTD